MSFCSQSQMTLPLGTTALYTGKLGLEFSQVSEFPQKGNCALSKEDLCSNVASYTYIQNFTV